MEQNKISKGPRKEKKKLRREILKMVYVLTCCQNWARIRGPCDLVVNQSKDSIGL